MNNRLLEVLILVAEALQQSNDASLALSEQTRNELIEKGFTNDEVQNAIHWIGERLPLNKGKRAIRVLSNFERIHLTTKGSGLLLKLRNLNLLTDEHIELIIARALLLNELPIDAESVRNMAFVLLFDLKNHHDGFSMYVDSDKNDLEN
ncbi:DUF494 family protein [bacterium]|nr:DUF494 family protein [bacterium]